MPKCFSPLDEIGLARSDKEITGVGRVRRRNGRFAEACFQQYLERRIVLQQLVNEVVRFVERDELERRDAVDRDADRLLLAEPAYGSTVVPGVTAATAFRPCEPSRPTHGLPCGTQNMKRPFFSLASAR
jgi:hypothetical protein